MSRLMRRWRIWRLRRLRAALSALVTYNRMEYSDNTSGEPKLHAAIAWHESLLAAELPTARKVA